MTDNTGAIVGAFTYDPYGNTIAATGSATTPIGYAGAYKDSESGFLYLINRYYNPTAAQFLTVDPALAVTRAPYTYAGDDPVNRTDPTGLAYGCPNAEPFQQNPDWVQTGLGSVDCNVIALATDNLQAPHTTDLIMGTTIAVVQTVLNDTYGNPNSPYYDETGSTSYCSLNVDIIESQSSFQWYAFYLTQKVSQKLLRKELASFMATTSPDSIAGKLLLGAFKESIDQIG